MSEESTTAETKKRHKSFGTPANLQSEPVTFELYGEEFSAYPEVQGVQLLKFSKRFSAKEGEVVSDALLDFFKLVLHPESYTRIEKLWDDKDRIVPIETISDIVTYLIEQYTDRPTK